MDITILSIIASIILIVYFGKLGVVLFHKNATKRFQIAKYKHLAGVKINRDEPIILWLTFDDLSFESEKVTLQKIWKATIRKYSKATTQFFKTLFKSEYNLLQRIKVRFEKTKTQNVPPQTIFGDCGPPNFKPKNDSSIISLGVRMLRFITLKEQKEYIDKPPLYPISIRMGDKSDPIGGEPLKLKLLDMHKLHQDTVGTIPFCDKVKTEEEVMENPDSCK